MLPSTKRRGSAEHPVARFRHTPAPLRCRSTLPRLRIRSASILGALALLLGGLIGSAAATGVGPTAQASTSSVTSPTKPLSTETNALAAIAHLRVPIDPEAEFHPKNTIQSTYCARTMNELRQLAQNLQLVSGARQIRLAAGTFLFGQNETIVFDGRGFIFGINPGEISLIGGYNSDCSSRTPDARLTVLRNETGTSGGLLELWGSRHSIVVINLTLNLNASLGKEGLGSFASTETRQGQRIILDHVRSQSGRWELDIGSHNLLIDNLLKTGGSTLAWLNRFGHVQPYTVGMINSTLVSTSFRIRCFDSDCLTPLGRVDLYNSVFSATDVQLDGAFINLQYNLNGLFSAGFGSAIIGSEGNIDAPALLDGNFIPSFNSPAVDSGTAAVPGNLALFDNIGQQRIRGVAVDRGALESSFDSSTPSLHLVTNTNATGTGSLRQAIINAGINGGANRIQFAIPGSECPKRIVLSEPMPQIQNDLSIEGYSQIGSVPNSSSSGWNAVPCVLVSGNNNVTLGLTAASGSRLRVSGLGFEGFTSGAISIIGGVDHIIVGSQFGGSIGNRVLQANNVNISVALQGRRARIGGPEPSQRNLLSRATGSAVSLNIGTSENSVVNNLIGTRANPLQSDPNGTGVLINRSSGNEIAGNRIYGNTLDGVRIQGLEATDNVIADNLFSTANLASGLGNGRHAVWVREDARDNRIGPNNVMSFHAESPIRISEGRRNEVSGNRIGANAQIGIDIGNPGVNPIQGGVGLGSCIGEVNANCRRNAPQITRVAIERVNLLALRLVIDFVMLAPNGLHRVEIFESGSCQDNNPEGHGPGLHPLVTTQVNVINGPDPNTSVWLPLSFRATVPLLPGALPAEGSAITAVAIDSGGNTSEFSRCFTLRSEEIFANGFE